ncbi:S8 family peptidase [Lachnospiraceae bacterium JLR.KK008]
MTCEERIRSEDYRELLIDYNFEETEATHDARDYCRVVVDGNISIIYYQINPNEMVDISLYPYNEVPKCYGLMQQEQPSEQGPFDSLALSDAGILQVQREPLSLTGRGVVIGFIDTGIRYTQDVFRNAAGESRILSIWDQTIYDGSPPDGFLYGTEYGRQQINEALRSPMPREIVPSWDTDGHGTAMASVAAGSNLESGRRFVGAAPDADIVVVKLRGAKQYLRDYYILPENVPAFAETDVVMAVKYIESFAIDLERPVVICLGIGTNFGSHTGSSVLDRYLTTISERRNRAIVVCGGNEGAASHHFRSVLSSEVQTVEMRVGEAENGFLLEMWTEGPSHYRMTIRTPGGEKISGIVDRSRRTQEYRFVFDRTIIMVNSLLLAESTGRGLLLFRFVTPTQGVWTFTIETVSFIQGSSYNMWLPIEDFVRDDTFFLRPEPDITLTAPSMSGGVITINAYNDEDGSFYEKSGRGFAADGRVKPQFAAPGVNVSTSLGKRTGSSLAAAIAAGAVTQLMQWAVIDGQYLLASGRELTYYLMLGAVRDSNIEYPSKEWGYGKINVQRTFEELSGLFR